MRGKQVAEFGSGCIDGITPADAGKTVVMLEGNFKPWDHPRGCGENKCCGAVHVGA